MMARAVMLLSWLTMVGCAESVFGVRRVFCENVETITVLTPDNPMHQLDQISVEGSERWPCSLDVFLHGRSTQIEESDSAIVVRGALDLRLSARDPIPSLLVETPVSGLFVEPMVGRDLSVSLRDGADATVYGSFRDLDLRWLGDLSMYSADITGTYESIEIHAPNAQSGGSVILVDVSAASGLVAAPSVTLAESTFGRLEVEADSLAIGSTSRADVAVLRVQALNVDSYFTGRLARDSITVSLDPSQSRGLDWAALAAPTMFLEAMPSARLVLDMPSIWDGVQSIQATSTSQRIRMGTFDRPVDFDIETRGKIDMQGITDTDGAPLRVTVRSDTGNVTLLGE